jgi:hypothetical protein
MGDCCVDGEDEEEETETAGLMVRNGWGTSTP